MRHLAPVMLLAALLLAATSAASRITSYNVCYTKLLRCGVTYGFQPEGFEQTPPDILVDSLEDLADQILAGTPPRA